MQAEVGNTLKIRNVESDERDVVNKCSRSDNGVGNEHGTVDLFALSDNFAGFIGN